MQYRISTFYLLGGLVFTPPKVFILALAALVVVVGCGGNRSESEDGDALKVPGDSVRLEDTLSAPPPSDSARAQ